MQTRSKKEWRDNSDMVIVPDVTGMEWDAFGGADKLIQAGEIAALRGRSENQGVAGGVPGGREGEARGRVWVSYWIFSGEIVRQLLVKTGFGALPP